MPLFSHGWWCQYIHEWLGWFPNGRDWNHDSWNQKVTALSFCLMICKCQLGGLLLVSLPFCIFFLFIILMSIQSHFYMETLTSEFFFVLVFSFALFWTYSRESYKINLNLFNELKKAASSVYQNLYSSLDICGCELPCYCISLSKAFQVNCMFYVSVTFLEILFIFPYEVCLVPFFWFGKLRCLIWILWSNNTLKVHLCFPHLPLALVSASFSMLLSYGWSHQTVESVIFHFVLSLSQEITTIFTFAVVLLILHPMYLISVSNIF